MKDFLGRELAVGDLVVHASGVSGGLSGPSEIEAFTEKRVRLKRKFYRNGLCVPPENLVKVEA
ncbi:hypothetical protein LAG72_24920 [Escherichia coli]|uniref:Uncharacterized protein n=1 Tax=Rhizobium phage RHEph21 TaxID=2836134 RepID=A0AAE7VMV5_9CAUD|nr:hypothetical protein [Escherichia coli]MBZ5864369.1 hypothetical protein [Escherichia coli]QXV74638.1 hypothetical protein [Rhizobium phage RHEph21]